MRGLSLIILIVLATVFKDTLSNDKTLRLVIGIFRHGHRTNEDIGIYPKDPHRNYSYYPYGRGELTNEGKKRAYQLGKILRQRYNDYLGPVYTPDVLFATSTNLNRAIMSLQLVLAGLYPPTLTELEWDSQLNWSPIPFSSGEHLNYLPPILYCPEYRQLYEDYIKSEPAKQMISKYIKWFSYLSQHTGVKVRAVYNLAALFYHLEIQREFGMTIPFWTFPIHPHTTRSATIDCLNSFSATKELRQLYGGKFLKKIVNIIDSKVNNTLTPSTRKLYLYSGHDVNILTTLSALNADFDHIPPYGACLLLELHQNNKNHFIRIYYQDYTSDEMKQLNVRGCSKDCSFDKFIKLIQENLPVDDSLCNNVTNLVNILD